MRIGVFGGSFDPIHIGHLIAAESVREAFGLDRVMFVPAFQPPHKPLPPVAPPALRLKMTEAASLSNIGLFVSDTEIRRQGTSYTVDTLHDLHGQHPGVKLYFILGADLLPGLSKWRAWERLAELATFVGVHRPGAKTEVPDDVRPHVKLIEIPGVDVSSSMIRARVAAGKGIRYLVPAAVEDIIKEESLYRNGKS